MPLEDAQSIDRIESNEPGKLRLVIVDTGETSDPTERLDALLAKLRTYVGYCLNDEFSAQHPGVELSGVTIVVESSQPPTDDMARIHEVGPEGDRSRVVRVEFTSPATVSAHAHPVARPQNESPLDRLTPARIHQLRIVAIICAMAGGVVFVVWFGDMLDARRLDRDGAIVEGTVLGANLLDKAYGRNKYKLPVQYTAIDKDQQERSVEKVFLVREDVYERARVAGMIEVRYLPDDLLMSDVESHNPTPMNYLATALELWVVALVGWVVLWRLEKRVAARGARAIS